MLAAGILRHRPGGGNPDRGYFSRRGAAVSGGVPADRLRLCLLPALGKERSYEHRSLEISQSSAGYSAEIVPGEGISTPGSSYSRT